MNFPPTNSLSPWAHPKAQEWLVTIFEKSGLLNELENWAFANDQVMDFEHQRLLASLLLILGHPEIWPSTERDRLENMVKGLVEANRIRVLQKPPQLSLEESQRAAALKTEWDVELEMLRRRVGVSRKVNKLEKPRSWCRFWK